jgi:hypothetical protein
VAETDPQEPLASEGPEQDRLTRLETTVEALQGQLSAYAIVIEFLVKAMATIDGESSEAIAMGLEVAEMDHIDTYGETETAKALRSLRERLGFVLPTHED